MKSSRAAVDLIVSFEVTSKAVYEKKYQRPEWPGEASGITVGIGYDLGYNTASDIAKDWAGKVPAATIAAMQHYAGATGTHAKELLPTARRTITIPWDAAMAVFMEVSLPKFEALTLRACPGSEKLPAGCFGVLSSVTYNRGASYTKARGPKDTVDRYREMRAIRALVLAGKWDAVPAQIISMKRLWDIEKSPGLHRRRDEEAALWAASLRAAPVAALDDDDDEVSNRIDTGDDKSDSAIPPIPVSGVTPAGNGINVQPTTTQRSFEVELIQRELIDFKYFEVGDPDGLIGGKFVAGTAAFMNDRGYGPNHGGITDDLRKELAAAKVEKLPNGDPWTRPIATARATATAKDLAPKIASINSTWWQKLLAWVLGLPALGAAGLKNLFGDDTTGGYISQIKGVFSAIPQELYLLGVVGLAIAIFFAAKSSQDSTVKAYNEGKIN